MGWKFGPDNKCCCPEFLFVGLLTGGNTPSGIPTNWSVIEIQTTMPDGCRIASDTYLLFYDSVSGSNTTYLRTGRSDGIEIIFISNDTVNRGDYIKIWDSIGTILEAQRNTSTNRWEPLVNCGCGTCPTLNIREYWGGWFIPQSVTGINFTVSGLTGGGCTNESGVLTYDSSSSDQDGYYYNSNWSYSGSALWNLGITLGNSSGIVSCASIPQPYILLTGGGGASFRYDRPADTSRNVYDAPDSSLFLSCGTCGSGGVLTLSY